MEALKTPNSNVCSIYAPEYAEHVYECLRNIRQGNAIFTFPNSPVKCPGAPQKIVYIAEHYFRKVRVPAGRSTTGYTNPSVYLSVGKA